MSENVCPRCGSDLAFAGAYSHDCGSSVTWPLPTLNEDQRRTYIDAELVERLERQKHERRAKWRQRRGWDTP